MKRTLFYSLIGLVGCICPAGCREKVASVQTIIIEFVDLVDQVKTVQPESMPEIKTEPEKTVNTQTADLSTDESSDVTQTTASLTITVEQTTADSPPTTVHTHTWVPVTKVVHHDAIYKDVWVQDSAAWDETIVTKEAWDESVLVQGAYDEEVLVQDAYDEPVYGWIDICNRCGHVFSSGEDVGVHMAAGCWSSWHAEWMQIGTTHHDAVYQTVYHDAVYQTVHHDAVYQIVHHDAAGHYENTVDQDAWDETVITGYTCFDCGEKK